MSNKKKNSNNIKQYNKDHKDHKDSKNKKDRKDKRDKKRDKKYKDRKDSDKSEKKKKSKERDKDRERDKEREQDKDREKEKKKYMFDEFMLDRKVGSGTFGDVYSAVYLADNKIVALKVEDRQKKRSDKESMLVSEYKIYKNLTKNGMVDGIPYVYELKETPEYNILVMELLNKSIDVLFTECNKKFQLSTVLNLGYNMTNLLEKVHLTGYIHRDIKPNNFMVGNGDNMDKLYIMDFGLSKCYKVNGKHISYKTDRSLIGTARYASTNIHLGIEPSRRDDIESVGYMLIYFIIGSLPWQGLKKEKDVDHLHQIGDMKICTNIDKLCKGLPHCFKEYVNYAKNLEFDQEPDYSYLKGLFASAAIESGCKLEYEWITNEVNKKSAN